MAPAIEAIVVHHFKEFYATCRNPTKTRFWREVAADCQAKGLTPPSIRRLGRWLDLKDQAKLMARREGKDKAERRQLATPGMVVRPAIPGRTFRSSLAGLVVVGTIDSAPALPRERSSRGASTIG
nr:hypothetical protein [Sedimentitalea todarodis]